MVAVINSLKRALIHVVVLQLLGAGWRSEACVNNLMRCILEAIKKCMLVYSHQTLTIKTRLEIITDEREMLMDPWRCKILLNAPMLAWNN